MRVASFDALRKLVEAQIGIACLPIGCIKSYARHQDLVAIPLTDAWADWQLEICARDMRTCPEATRRFPKELNAVS